MDDTIFALSSGALPAAIAVVRCSGPRAEAALEGLAGPLPPPRQLTLRDLRAADGALVDRALIARFPAPATVTGEPLVEFHVHGSRAVVARLLAELGSMSGLRLAERGEFTRRAMLNGRLDLTEAEGLGELLAAETEWQRRAALQSAGGALRREIEGWRERLVLLAAEAEAAIDYVDEEETELELDGLCAGASRLHEEWRQRLAQPPAEQLSDGLRVVLAGPPNSGKSSLFNALVGAEKAIVTPIPGTTRDLVEARLDLDGLPILLIDTAGIRSSEDVVEQIGVERAQEAVAAADILLWLGDPVDALSHERVILIHGRADDRSDAVPAGSIATSSVTSQGLPELHGAIVALGQNLLPPSEITTLNYRQRQTLADAADSLSSVVPGDALLTAEALRQSLFAIDTLSGRQGREDVLDEIFSHFCLGK